MKNFIKKKLRKKNYLQQEYFRTLVFTNQLLSPGRDRLGAFYCIFFLWLNKMVCNWAVLFFALPTNCAPTNTAGLCSFFI